MTDPSVIAEALRRDGFDDPVPAVGQVWELPLSYLDEGERFLSRITALSKTVSGWQCRVKTWTQHPRSGARLKPGEGVLHVRRLVDEYRPVWCPVPDPDGDPSRQCTKLIPQGWTQDEGHAGGHMWMTERMAAIFDGGHYDATAAISGLPFTGHLPEECTPDCPRRGCR